MKKNLKVIFGILIGTLTVALFVGILRNSNFEVLNPAGMIATKERNLMSLAAILMLVVAIPVFVMTFTIAWKYRASNTKATYQPNWDHNTLAEVIWWGIPCIIIAILSVVTWNSSHELDPSQSIVSSKAPITIQVVALQWKWLFIYPEQGIATVNYLEFPENTPVHFEVTSDAPMNAFWIPQLGSQIYAMPGMSMPLHLIADKTGSYDGLSANISGAGFAGMKFKATSASAADFNSWVESVQQSPDALTSYSYTTLAEPTINTPPTSFASVPGGLYNQIVMKYVMPMRALDDASLNGMIMNNNHIQ